MRLLHWVAAATFVAGCREKPLDSRSVTPADTTTAVSFRYAGPNETALVVPVTINGQGPFDFVLDTGATLSCVDETLQQRLRLPVRKGEVRLGTGIGQTGRFQLVQADTFRVGDATVRQLPVCILDLRQFRSLGVDIHGLVGLDYLRRFRLTLDFDRKLITLDPANGS